MNIGHGKRSLSLVRLEPSLFMWRTRVQISQGSLGQRIKPKGIQLGISRDWRSINSIICKKKRKEIIFEDILIRDLLKNLFRKQGYKISEIYIKRAYIKDMIINITVFPSYGKRKLIEIYKILNIFISSYDLKINIRFTNTHIYDAHMIGEYIKGRYGRQMRYKRRNKKTILRFNMLHSLINWYNHIVIGSIVHETLLKRINLWKHFHDLLQNTFNNVIDNTPSSSFLYPFYLPRPHLILRNTLISKDTDISIPRKIPPYLSGFYNNNQMLNSYYFFGLRRHSIFKNSHFYRFKVLPFNWKYINKSKFFNVCTYLDKIIQKEKIHLIRKIHKSKGKSFNYYLKLPLFDNNLNINELDYPYLLRNPFIPRSSSSSICFATLYPNLNIKSLSYFPSQNQETLLPVPSYTRSSRSLLYWDPLEFLFIIHKKVKTPLPLFSFRFSPYKFKKDLSFSLLNLYFRDFYKFIFLDYYHFSKYFISLSVSSFAFDPSFPSSHLTRQYYSRRKFRRPRFFTKWFLNSRFGWSSYRKSFRKFSYYRNKF